MTHHHHHSSGRVFIVLWARALCFLASRLTTVSLDLYHHSSGRVFIVLWARALCFLASRLTTVSLDLYMLDNYITSNFMTQ